MQTETELGMYVTNREDLEKVKVYLNRLSPSSLKIVLAASKQFSSELGILIYLRECLEKKVQSVPWVFIIA